MALPPDFQFSQTSLQDFVDCHRRFELRYLLKVAWPALEAEPAREHERLILLGERLHRMIQQHLLGVSEEILSRGANERELQIWWQNYLAFSPAELPALRYPEITLVAPIAGYRLAAKFDMVAVDPGSQLAIVDWKTSFKQPSRQWLSKRLQTRVYRFLIVLAGSQLNDAKTVRPDQVEMIYWFANQPRYPVHFAYNDKEFKADEAYLSSLVIEIDGLEEGEFELTDQRVRCRYCQYRSLCNRGIGAGTLNDISEVSAPGDSFDSDSAFDQIAEIEL